jgi:hypothetical protein
VCVYVCETGDRYIPPPSSSENGVFQDRCVTSRETIVCGSATMCANGSFLGHNFCCCCFLLLLLLLLRVVVSTIYSLCDGDVRSRRIRDGHLFVGFTTVLHLCIPSHLIFLLSFSSCSASLVPLPSSLPPSNGAMTLFEHVLKKQNLGCHFSFFMCPSYRRCHRSLDRFCFFFFWSLFESVYPGTFPRKFSSGALFANPYFS